MDHTHPDNSVEATCHCGAIVLTLQHPPRIVRHCNCSLCRRYGVLWAYYGKEAVTFNNESTDSYAWGDEHVDFHRCHTCGCVTHWLPRNTSRNKVGINARLLDQTILNKADIEYKDSAETGIFH